MKNNLLIFRLKTMTLIIFKFGLPIISYDVKQDQGYNYDGKWMFDREEFYKF